MEIWAGRAYEDDFAFDKRFIPIDVFTNPPAMSSHSDCEVKASSMPAQCGISH